MLQEVQQGDWAMKRQAEQPDPLVTPHLLFFTMGVMASKLPSLQ